MLEPSGPVPPAREGGAPSDLVRRAPKVLLHDHLDGGLRPDTILEIADDIGHPLPASDAPSLGSWFTEASDSGSLVRYLSTFDHTVAVDEQARGTCPSPVAVPLVAGGPAVGRAQHALQ